jgi:hypothetical protein
MADELQELNDLYTWEVNAAIESGEESLIEALSEEYTDRALRLITGPRGF